jgi:nitrite reductase/ring-hydroxylating ferredoxin subunit
MRTFYAVGTAEELEPGDRLRVEVNGTELVVANVDGRFHAFDHACPHERGPLGEGPLVGARITCPSHRWVYDVRSGLPQRHDRPRLPTYPVKIHNNEILVEVPPVEAATTEQSEP